MGMEVLFDNCLKYAPKLDKLWSDKDWDARLMVCSLQFAQFTRIFSVTLPVCRSFLYLSHSSTTVGLMPAAAH